jgi:hypothetical protein
VHLEYRNLDLVPDIEVVQSGQAVLVANERQIRPAGATDPMNRLRLLSVLL